MGAAQHILDTLPLRFTYGQQTPSVLPHASGFVDQRPARTLAQRDPCQSEWRPIFGNIRFMSYDDTSKKFNSSAHIARVE